MEFSRRAFIGSIAALIATPQNVFSLPVVGDVPGAACDLPMVRLFHEQSLAVERGLMTAGHWGIQTDDEKFTDLGPRIQMKIANVYPKAMEIDTRGERPVIMQTFDPHSEAFVKAFNAGFCPPTHRAHFMWGTEFLVQVNGEWLRYFAGSSSTRHAFMSHMNSKEVVAEVSQVITSRGYRWNRPVITSYRDGERGLPRTMQPMLDRPAWCLYNVRGWPDDQFREHNGLYLPERSPVNQ